MSRAQPGRIIALVVALLTLGQAHAQDWDHRHTFAKSYCGLSLIGVRAMGEGLLVDEDVVTPFGRRAFVSPAVNVRATHFWGHADFYVSINTSLPSPAKPWIPSESRRSCPMDIQE